MNSHWSLSDQVVKAGMPASVSQYCISIDVAEYLRQ